MMYRDTHRGIEGNTSSLLLLLHKVSGPSSHERMSQEREDNEQEENKEEEGEN